MANITKIDGYDIKDAFAQKGMVFYEEPTGTAGSGSSPYLSTKWQVESVEGTITEPYNGMRMVVKVPVAGVSTAGVVLSIDNGVTWHPVRYNNSTLTTHYAAGTVTLVVYDSTTSQTAYITAGTSTTITGVWRCVADYDSNTTNIVNILKPGGTSLLKTQLGRYRLLLTVDGTTVLPFNNTNYTNATTARAVTQEQFDPFGQIYFYNTTTVRAANYALAASTLQQQYYSSSYSLIGYSYVTTLTANKWIFLKATMQSNGMAILNADTSTGGPIVQDLPTTDDGFIYIFLGYAASSSLFTLDINHPIYYYKDGKVRLFTSAGQLSSKDAIGNISATGTMTDTADAPASGDYLITRDASTNAVQTSNINAVDVNTAVTNNHTHVNIELSTTAQDYDGKGHTIKLPAVSPYSDTNYYHSTPNPVWSGTDGTTFKAANNGGTGCPDLEFTLPNASTTQKGVALLGASGGAATYARVEELALTIVDEKVVQTASTTDAYYPILMSESASPTSGAAAKAKYSTDATFNPNMNTFRIKVPNDIDPTKYESMYLRSGAITFENEYTEEHVQMTPQNIMVDVDGDSFVQIRKDRINIDTKDTDVRYNTNMFGAELQLQESIATASDPFGPVHYESVLGVQELQFVNYDTTQQTHSILQQTQVGLAGLTILANDPNNPGTLLTSIAVSNAGITDSHWTASKFVKTDANKMLVTADLTSGDVTTALGYTPTSNTGTVTSVQVQATSPVQSSTSTASTTTLSTTISLESGYGDTQNPYNTKNPNTFLSGPVSGNASAPTFRTIDIADLPAAVKDRMRYLGTKDCSNTTLGYYLGLNKNDTFTIVPSGNYSTLNVSTQLGRSATAYIGDVVTCYDYDGTLGSTHGYWYIIPSGRVAQYDYSNIGQSGDKYPLLGSYTQSPNTNTYPTGYDTHVTIEPSTHSFYLNDQMTDTETGTVSVETQVSPSTYIQSVDWTLPNNAGYVTIENQLSPTQFTMNYIETYGETTTNHSLSVQLSGGNVILNLSNDNNTTEITPEVVTTPSIEIVDNNLHGKKLKLDTNGFVAATTDADYTRTISQLTFDANNDATITMGDSVNSQYMYGNISDDSTIGIMSYNTTSMYVGTLTYILIKNTSSAAKTVTFDIQTQFELVGGGTYSIPNGKYMEFSIFVLNGTTAILTNSNEMDSITGSLQ